MSQLAQRVSPSIPKRQAVSSLNNGDRLTRPEFERRYNADDRIRAELIEGVVYVSSPVSAGGHASPHAQLVTLCGNYLAATAGVFIADNGTVRLDADNEPQPDILLMRLHAGTAKIDTDDYVAGAPEWIAEIAASSASYDLHDKLRAYRRNGVREYVVWRTLDGEIDYFVLQDGEYRKATPAADGIVKSAVFPGLWLNIKALLTGDLAAAIQTMQAGIASPEHAAFAAAT